MGFLGTLAKGFAGFVTGGPVGAAAAVLGPRLIGGGGPSPVRIPGFAGGGLPLAVGGPRPQQGVCPPGTALRVERRMFGPDITECVPTGVPQVNGRPAQGGVAGVCACGISTQACVEKPCTCCLPGGRKGVSNRTRYFRKVDRCADSDDPGSYELVQPGTRCVARRSIDPGNSRAARRAVSRLNAHYRQLQRTQKALERIAKPRRRRRS